MPEAINASCHISIPRKKNPNFPTIAKLDEMKIYLAGNGAMPKEQRESLYNPPPAATKKEAVIFL